QRRGGRQVLEEQLAHWRSSEGRSQIQREKAAHVLRVLLVERLFPPELPPDLVLDRRGGELGRQVLRRITRQPNQEKDQRGDEEDADDRLSQPAEDVSNHTDR